MAKVSIFCFFLVAEVPNAMRYTIVRVFNEVCTCHWFCIVASLPPIGYEQCSLFSSFQAIQQQLQRGKVPCLCAIVKAFSLTEADASVLLKDPTGTLKLICYYCYCCYWNNVVCYWFFINFLHLTLLMKGMWTVKRSRLICQDHGS